MELDSDIVAEPIPTGTEVAVEDEAANSRGVQRLRISTPSSGWISRKVVEAMATKPKRAVPDPIRALGLGAMPAGHPCPPQAIGELSDRRQVATLALG